MTTDFADFLLETARLMSQAQAEEMLTDIALRKAFKALDEEERAARAKETEHGNHESTHS